MARRSYAQQCSLARALDVVGERWTLLIVRELMLGPKRFRELLEGLPGISRHLLSARLRQMREAGLLEQRPLAPPSRSHAYELTDDGRALGPAMAELGRWGIERLGRAPSTMAFRAAWGVFPLSYMANTAATRGIRETYEFRVDDERFHLRVDDGAIVPYAGEAENPDLVVTMDTATLLAMFNNDLNALDAIASGRVTVEGSPSVLEHAVAILAGSPEDGVERAR